MHVISNILNTIVLLGALQGFIVAALLNYTKGNDPSRLSRRLLARLIFFLSLACLNLYFYEQSWIQNTTVGAVLSAIVPLLILMPVGPLLYFYVQSRIDRDFTMQKKYRWHFVPVVIDIFPQAAAIVYIAAMLLNLIKNTTHSFGAFIDSYDAYSDIPRWVSWAAYSYLSFRYLLKARKKIDSGVFENGTPGELEISRKRLQSTFTLVKLFLAFAGLWLVFIIPYMIPKYSNKLINAVDWYPLYIPIVCMIYWLGIKGYFIDYREAYPAAPTLSLKKAASVNLLPQHVIDQSVLALDKAMKEEKLWLNPELSLSVLSAHCQIPAKTISTVLNQVLHKSFNEFVNEFRIEAVKQKLSLPESKELTIAGLAYDCGFNSLPTFQRAFKSMTGMSPKEYVANNDISPETNDQIAI